MFDLSVIVAWAKRRGFVYPVSDIYGGLANAWDYGPYGIQLKKNIQDLWWHTFVERRPDMIGLDSQILMHPQVWVASGHVAGFNDPLIDDKNTGERFRADKLIEEHIEQIRVKYAALEEQARDQLINSYRKEKDSEYEHMQNVAASFEHADHFLLDERKKHYQVANLIPESWSLEQMREVIVGEGIRNPHSKKDPDWTDVRKFELMFYTHQGVIHDDESKIWMRPETAQGIFVNFKNILDTTRMRLPFGIAQVGKAFRNEITPGNFLYRTREFEQMEIEYFVSNDESVAMESFKERQEMSMERRQTTMQLNQDNLRFREHESDELSHYSRGTFDVEYHYPR
jgi:glycyl-tRNA synthetase